MSAFAPLGRPADTPWGLLLEPTPRRVRGALGVVFKALLANDLGRTGLPKLSRFSISPIPGFAVRVLLAVSEDYTSTRRFESSSPIAERSGAI